MRIFTALFEDLLKNLRSILSCPIPTSSTNYPKNLRELERKVFNNIRDLEQDHDDKLIVMRIPGETDLDPRSAEEEKKASKKILFLQYWKELDGLAHDWCSGESLKGGPRDWSRDREKVKTILKKIERASVASILD